VSKISVKFGRLVELTDMFMVLYFTILLYFLLRPTSMATDKSDYKLKLVILLLAMFF